MAQINIKSVAIRLREKRKPKILDVVAITEDGKEVSIPYTIECWSNVLPW